MSECMNSNYGILKLANIIRKFKIVFVEKFVLFQKDLNMTMGLNYQICLFIKFIHWCEANTIKLHVQICCSYTVFFFQTVIFYLNVGEWKQWVQITYTLENFIMFIGARS